MSFYPLGLDLEEAALKDILNLVYLSEYFGLPEVADFWEGVVKLNSGTNTDI